MALICISTIARGSTVSFVRRQLPSDLTTKVVRESSLPKPIERKDWECVGVEKKKKVRAKANGSESLARWIVGRFPLTTLSLKEESGNSDVQGQGKFFKILIELL